MKKKLMIALPVLLIVLGGAYKTVLAKPAPEHKPKVDGEVYVMPRDFLINLSDGRFAKLNVALVLEHGALAPAGGEAEASAPPEGYGALPQEAVVRDIVNNAVMGTSGDKIIKRRGREQLKRRILKTILKKTDVKAKEVLFTDVAVQ